MSLQLCHNSLSKSYTCNNLPSRIRWHKWEHLFSQTNLHIWCQGSKRMPKSQLDWWTSGTHVISTASYRFYSCFQTSQSEYSHQLHRTKWSLNYKNCTRKWYWPTKNMSRLSCWCSLFVTNSVGRLTLGTS